MATFTGPRAERKMPTVGHGYGGTPIVVRGYINVAANPADGDIYELCWTPPKFLMFWGMWSLADIDTGTEALDIDLGWAANGGTSGDTARSMDGTEWTDVGYQADPDGLSNAGVLTGDAVANLTAAGASARLILPGQPLYFHSKTLIQAEANAAANAFTAGYMNVWLNGEIIG